jgi:hypothetical protein
MFGYVDDGAEYTPTRALHAGGRVPAGIPLDLETTMLLHYKFMAEGRALARLRYYQAWETVDQARTPLALYRMYHRATLPSVDLFHPVDPRWLEGYERAGIDMRTVSESDGYFDELTLDLIIEFGPEAFRKTDIWDVNWNELAARLGRTLDQPIRDPRGPGTRAAHAWLAASQNRPSAFATRLGQRFLRARGW